MTSRKSFKLLAILMLAFTFLVTSCNNKDNNSAEETAKLSIDFEKYELENGLDVVLHQDKSDPIVSLAIQYGVGSNREKTGRTGFAHLFEHMLFQESEAEELAADSDETEESLENADEDEDDPPLSATGRTTH